MAQATGADVTLLNVAPREPDVFGHQLKRKVITDPIPEDVRERYEKLMECAARLESQGVTVTTIRFIVRQLQQLR